MPMTAKKFDRRLAAAAVALVAAYLVLAYLAAPFAWRHYEHQTRLADLGARTVTAQGIPGDVINVGLEGTEEDVVCAMTAAGWSPSDPVTLSGQITHHVAPDIDAERDFLSGDLEQAKKVETTYWVSGVGPTLFGRNGGGDPFFTDGEIAFAKLAPGCETHENPPVALAAPARIAVKNAVFSWLAALWRRL